MKLEINKNIILLYALLNRFDQALGGARTTELRTEMIDYFKDYAGTEPIVEDYIHTSKCFFWCMTVSKVPEFEPKAITIGERYKHELHFGSRIKPYLLEFYENSDFENYFAQLLPKLKKIYEEFDSEFKKIDFKKLLEATWGIKSDAKMIVMLNPFTQSSFGPQIGDINYQMLGMWGNRKLSSYSHNIIHEGSHPYAKEVLKPFLKDIENISSSLEKAYEDPNFSNSYKTWSPCFEEHLVRVVHRGLINPKIQENFDLKKNLDFERDNNGMIFAYDFYDVLEKSDSVTAAIPEIIKTLKEKY